MAKNVNAQSEATLPFSRALRQAWPQFYTGFNIQLQRLQQGLPLQNWAVQPQQALQLHNWLTSWAQSSSIVFRDRRTPTTMYMYVHTMFIPLCNGLQVYTPITFLSCLVSILHTRTRARTHTLSVSHSLIHTYPDTHTLSLPPSLTHTHTHTFTYLDIACSCTKHCFNFQCLIVRNASELRLIRLEKAVGKGKIDST